MKWFLPGVLLILSGYLGGCAAAAVGAGAALYYTDRGVESLVDANVDDVYSQSQDVLHDMGIKIVKTEIEPDGNTRQIEGKKGDTEVTVKLKADEKSNTEIEVIAQKNAVNWDKEFAHKVLSQIVKKS